MKIDPASALDRFVHELLAKMAFVLRRLDFDDRKQLTEQGAKSMRLVKELMTYGREYVSMSLGPKAANEVAEVEKGARPENSGDSASAIAKLRQATQAKIKRDSA
jgi:hypothetical protein